MKADPSLNWQNVSGIGMGEETEYDRGEWWLYDYNSNEWTAFVVSDICFRTYGAGENDPPTKPIINGENKGSPNEEYDYTLISTDVDNDQIYYYIDWGDGNIVGWDGSYNSEEELTISHSWESEGTYMIKYKARDINNAESDWGDLEVNMPKNKAINFIIH